MHIQKKHIYNCIYIDSIELSIHSLLQTINTHTRSQINKKLQKKK